MEGYTNISGNHEDFDDLDIEGRITLDEWNCDDESGMQEETTSEREEKRLLNIKVKLDDGGYGYVFSVKTTDHSVRWRCHLCDVLVIGQKHVDTHIQSKKHQVKMALPTHPSDLFSRVENKSIVEMPQLAPGEPVPPGFEDVVKRVTQIQATLDSHKSSPLIGLEYIVELTPDERGKEPMYVCILCDKKGDPRVAMAHITSFNHRSKYIGIHYPTANKAMFNAFPRSKDGRRGVSEIVTRICAKIEEKYGRLQPLVVEKDSFETKKDQIMKQIQQERHFRETPDETFVELVDKNVLDTLTPATEELPPSKPEPANEIDLKSTFVKGKITCDRSRLRTRGSEETEDDMKFGKFEIERKRPPGSRKYKSGDPNRKSLSSVSSVSSSSRSQSRSHSRSRSQSRSRSRSYSRSRYGRHGWREGKYGRGRWRRSRSGSRGWRRSRSGSRSRRSRSGSRHGRRSPDSPGRRYRYGRSGSPKYNRYRDNLNDDRHKFRDKSDREKSDVDPRLLEKTKWMKFRQEVDKIERDLAKELKFHEKNPEKHPMYPEEWKKFWNRRYKELQADGKDPSKHDFKPEWIEFWNLRMKEMHEENLKTKKEDLRLKIGLPNEQELKPLRTNRKIRTGDADVIVISPTQGSEEELVKKDVTVTDIKNTWKALTGSDIKDTSKRSPSPWEEGEPVSKHPRGLSPTRRPMRGGSHIRGRGGRPLNRYFRNNDDTDGGGVVTVLRLLTALESQLGSLGPRVNTLLASALSLEKANVGSSNSLLTNPENFVLLETVKEKLKGQLLAGIVERNMVMASRLCISNLADVLIKAEESVKSSHPAATAPKMAEPSSTTVPATASVPVAPSVPMISSVPATAGNAVPAAEPVTVPGVGAMDKIAIAKQIAAALVAQGKTDVTQEELEQLINAVVGMAQASAGSEHPISAATYVSQMQQQVGDIAESTSLVKSSANKIENKSPLQKLLSVVTSTSSSTSSAGPTNTTAKSDELRSNALALLQSAYEEPKRSPLRQALISNKASVSQKIGGKDPMSIFKNPSPSRVSGNDFVHSKHGMEDLSEQDLQTLLQNFKDLSSEEQQGLIAYLKKLETVEPDRVEKLRRYVNLEGGDSSSDGHGQKSMQNLKSSLKSSMFNRSEQSGRLSPFSLRQGGINPSHECEQQMGNNFSNKENEDQKKSLKLDDSDDDYSFEDIYNAASQKLKEREKAKLEEEKMKQLAVDGKERDEKIKSKSDDPSLILKETKEMIANLMGQLPSKFIQKQSGSPGSRKDSPSVLGHLLGTGTATQKVEVKSDLEQGGQRIHALGSNASQIRPAMQTVPSLDSSQQMYQGYPNSETSYSNQYGSQAYSGGQHQYSGPQQPGYSGGYQQSGGYYGSSQQQYPQNSSGNYDAYANQGPSGGNWNQYSNQYGQQPYRHPGPGPYSQYPNQPSSYY